MTRPPCPITAAALLASALAASCSYPTDLDKYAPIGGGVLRVVSSTPADGATDVKLGAAFVVVLSDYPDPSTVAFPAVQLRSGIGSRDLSLSVDLIDKSIIVQPTAPMVAGTQYELVLSTAIGSLGKAKLPETTIITFTTGQTSGGGITPPPARSLAADVEPLLASCALPGCHGDTSPAGSLSLTKARIGGQLVGVASSEVPALARVKAGDPASSYLLRKLLATPDIVGTQMPPGTRRDDADLRVISDWILGGAKP